MASILIVEDEAIVAMEYKRGLVNEGHVIIAIASTVKAALVAFHDNVPDIMLVDIKLKGDQDGIELATEIRTLSNIPILFLTGNSDAITLNRIHQISNTSFLSKPVLTKDLCPAVKKLLLVRD